MSQSKTIFKQTFINFYSSLTCGILLFFFILINFTLINIVPIVVLMPKEDHFNMLQISGYELIVLFSFIPMSMIFTTLSSVLSVQHENTYLISRGASKTKIFIVKALAQFIIFMFFILLYVILGLITGSYNMRRDLSHIDHSYPVDNPNLFSFGFSVEGIILPPVLFSFTSIFLGVISNYFLKNGINIIIGALVGSVWVVGYFLHLDRTAYNNYVTIVTIPCITLGFLTAFSLVFSLFFVRNMNVRV